MTIMTFLKRATGVSPTPFLNDVEELMKRADAAIRKLRLEAHRPDTGIADLLPGEPQRRVQAIESVVEQYLRSYTETKNNLHRGVTGPATAEAKSLRDDDAKKWEWHYVQRDVADMLILGMGEGNVEAHDKMVQQLQANPELSDETVRASFRINLRRVRARPYLDLLAGTWQTVYETFGIRENPVLLAQLCARAAAERRGWHRLPQEHLAQMLNADGLDGGEHLGSEAFRFLVGEKWFEDRYGNETETPATASAAETGEIREQQMIVSERQELAEVMAIAAARARGESAMPDAARRTEELTPIVRRSRTSSASGSSGSVDPDDIGAAIDAAEQGVPPLEATVDTELVLLGQGMQWITAMETAYGRRGGSELPNLRELIEQRQHMFHMLQAATVWSGEVWELRKEGGNYQLRILENPGLETDSHRFVPQMGRTRNWEYVIPPAFALPYEPTNLTQIAITVNELHNHIPGVYQHLFGNRSREELSREDRQMVIHLPIVGQQAPMKLVHNMTGLPSRPYVIKPCRIEAGLTGTAYVIGERDASPSLDEILIPGASEEWDALKSRVALIAAEHPPGVWMGILDRGEDPKQHNIDHDVVAHYVVRRVQEGRYDAARNTAYKQEDIFRYFMEALGRKGAWGEAVEMRCATHAQLRTPTVYDEIRQFLEGERTPNYLASVLTQPELEYIDITMRQLLDSVASEVNDYIMNREETWIDILVDDKKLIKFSNAWRVWKGRTNELAFAALGRVIEAQEMSGVTGMVCAIELYLLGGAIVDAQQMIDEIDELPKGDGLLERIRMHGYEYDEQADGTIRIRNSTRGVNLNAQLYEDDPPVGQRQQRQQTAAATVDSDEIGAAIDAAERGEAVRGTIIEPAGVQPVVFENLTIYNPNGQPFRTYRRVVLDGALQEGLRTQEGWIQHYAGTPRQLPSFPLLYAMIEDLVRSENSAKEGLLADLRHWIATSTKPHYGRNLMIHDAGRQPFEFPCPFPEQSNWARNLDADGQQTLKALLMPRDLASALQTLQTFSNVPPYLWVPNKKGRQDVPEWVAFADVHRYRFFLSCNYHPGNLGGNLGCSRGVAIEYASSPPSSAGLLEF